MFIDGVRNVLTGVVGMDGDDPAVQTILDMLDDSATTVRRSERIAAIPTSSLGQAPTALELHHHAGRAHAHVTNAMAELVAGLQGYYDSVRHFRQDTHETDGVVASDVSRLTSRADAVQAAEVLLDRGAACTQQDDFQAAPGCEVPTGDDA